jgi:D-glycero-D-manno-heptose 1,7-bisphosphate phosphatase
MPRATVTQCAILVGGLGTRLGALTAQTPKPLLPCGDRPFLAWLMREFTRFGVTDFLLLTGHLSEVVENAIPTIAATLPRGARISVSREPIRAGTGGAVFHARDRLADRFFLCNGDSLFDTNLAALLGAHAPATGRILLRRLDDASRYGVVDLEGDRVTDFLERPPTGTPGLINAGVYVFNRDLLDTLRPVCSLEAEVMPRLAREGRLRGVIGDGYFRDIGVPEDFARSQTEVPATLRRRALFLDRDGVINVDHAYVGTRERFEWIDGAREAVARATRAGWHVFIVTNQAGVARGFYSEAEARALMAWVEDEIRRAGGTIDDLRYCPFHPEARVPAYRALSDWRKPAPGMVLDLLRVWELDAGRCVMVGDQATDRAAAAAAGVAFRLFRGGRLDDFLSDLF